MSTRKPTRLRVLIAQTAALATAVTGLAAADSSADLEEIVVTSRKIEERLIDVPLTISAFTANDVAAAGLINIRDVAENTPGMFISSSQGRSGDRISIRGINTVNPTLGYVGVYVDGVFVASSSAQGVDLSGLERIEILKGPQSALFGRSTLSGAINYVTRQPGEEFKGQASVTFGQFNRRDISAGVSGPISGRWSFLISGRDFTADSGYVNGFDNSKSVGGQTTQSANFALRFKASDTFNANLRMVYVKDDDQGVAVAAQGPRSNNCLPAAAGGLPLYYCGQLQVNESQIFLATRNASVPAPFVGLYTSDDGEAGLNRRVVRSALTLNWDLGFADLTSISAYTTEKQRDGFDLTYRAAFTYAPVVRLPAITFDRQFEFEDLSQELRLVGNTEGKLGWLAGVYFFDDERSEVATYRLPSPAANAGTIGATNKAIFARLDYAVTDKLTLAAEARWQEDKVKYANPVNNLSAEAVTRSVLPRFTVDYNLAEDVMVYGVVSKGSKPVAINTAAELPAALRFTREEEAKNYELGMKGRFFDKRLTVLGSAFYIDWTNQQSAGICLPGECGGVAVITRYVTNFGKTSIRGFELETSGELIRDWLNVRMTYSNADTRIKSGRTSSAGEALEGIRAFGTQKVQPICAVGGAASPFCPAGQALQGATFVNLNTDIPAQPEKQWSTGLTLSRPLGDDLRWSARADYVWLSKQYESFYNLAWVGPRENLNLRLTLSSENWDVTLWGRNALDDKTPSTILRSIAFRSDDGGGYNSNSRAFAGFLPEQRNFGITATYRF